MVTCSMSVYSRTRTELSISNYVHSILSLLVFSVCMWVQNLILLVPATSLGTYVCCGSLCNV